MTHSLISANGQERTGYGVTIDLSRMVVTMEGAITGDMLEFDMQSIDRIELEETPTIIHDSGIIGANENE